MLRAFRALVILNAIALGLSSLWIQNEFDNNQFLQAWLLEHSLLWSRWAISIGAALAITTLALTFFRWKQLAGITEIENVVEEIDAAHRTARKNSGQS